MPDPDVDELDRQDRAKRRRLDAPDALARAAGWYAGHGIAVFPLQPGGKQPLLGKAHRDPDEQRECRGACGRDGHGLHDATTDLERVAGWWAAHPQANIGLPTGVRFDVLDVDGPTGLLTHADRIRHGGCPRRPDGITPACCDDGHCPGDGGVTLRELVGRVYGVVLTAGDNGGRHLYIPPTGERNGANLLPGIDYRGEGGYVVAPPSRGARGRYAWVEPLDVAALHAPAAA